MIMKNQNFYVKYYSKDFNFIYKATLSNNNWFKSLIHDQMSENIEGATSSLSKTIASLNVVCPFKHSYSPIGCGTFSLIV